MGKRILIVDDSMYIRGVIAEMIQEEGHEVVGEAQNGASAIDLAISLKPDVVTLDNILPDMMGLDVLVVFKEENVTSKVIMVSGVGQKEIVDKGLELGASSYITKPFNAEELINKINDLE